MALNLIRRLLKGAPLTAEEHDGNLDAIETAVEGNTAGLTALQNSLGNAATRNVGTTAGTVAAGDDSRFSGPRTPTAHKSTHATGGSDPLTPADIGAEVAGAAANAVSTLQNSLGNAATRNVGTTAGTVAAGDDSRFSEPRTPTAHKSTHATGGSDPLTPGDIGAEAAGAAASAVSAHAAAADPHPNYVLEANLQFTGPALAGRTAGTGGLEALTLGTGLSIVNGVLTVEGGTGGGTGADGASAYEIAVANGFVGTEAQWLASLVGPPGADGDSAYQVAVAAGFSGTEAQWLASLVGPAGADGADGAPGADGVDGSPGASAYEIAVAGGFTGTETEWLASLVGPAGADGADGLPGVDGSPGADGADGASAYQVAVAAGFAGTEAQWLASLVGPAGADGADGAPGADGADGAPGVGVPAGGTTGQALIKASGTDYDASWQTLTVSDVFIVACSDETSNLTAGTNKARFTMPYAGTLTAVKADVNTAPTGSTLVVDINEAGVSVLSTKLSIDAGETSSSTAATPAVISDSALANGAVISIDIDQIGSTVAGAGLKVTLYVTRS